MPTNPRVNYIFSYTKDVSFPVKADSNKSYETRYASIFLLFPLLFCYKHAKKILSGRNSVLKFVCSKCTLRYLYQLNFNQLIPIPQYYRYWFSILSETQCFLLNMWLCPISTTLVLYWLIELLDYNLLVNMLQFDLNYNIQDK